MDTPPPMITPFGLQAVPAGMGVLPMGSLDHRGYNMADKNDFYKKFIIELVPNNANHVTWYKNDLRPLNPSQPRVMTRLWNPTTRDACNAPDRMVVMYSKAEFGRGKIHRWEEVLVPEDDDAYWEARDWWYEGKARPRLISFSLPDTKNGYAPYIWIDLSWPIRNILLPISQENAVGEQPNCTYVQVNFR